MLTEIQQQTLDIEWFFITNNKIGFVTSAGGKLPQSVAVLDKKIGLISSFFRTLPEITTAIINDELENLKSTNVTEHYLNDFIYMAKRGLYTFDKSILNDFSDLKYHLVAKPENHLRLIDVPSEIVNLINKTTYKGDVDTCNLISVEDVI